MTNMKSTGMFTLLVLSLLVCYSHGILNYNTTSGTTSEEERMRAAQNEFQLFLDKSGDWIAKARSSTSTSLLHKSNDVIVESDSTDENIVDRSSSGSGSSGAGEEILGREDDTDDTADDEFDRVAMVTTTSPITTNFNGVNVKKEEEEQMEGSAGSSDRRNEVESLVGESIVAHGDTNALKRAAAVDSDDVLPVLTGNSSSGEQNMNISGVANQRRHLEKITRLLSRTDWRPPGPKDLVELFFNEVVVAVTKLKEQTVTNWILERNRKMDDLMVDMLRVILFIRNATNSNVQRSNKTLNATAEEKENRSKQTRHEFVQEIGAYVQAVLQNAVQNSNKLESITNESERETPEPLLPYSIVTDDNIIRRRNRLRPGGRKRNKMTSVDDSETSGEDGDGDEEASGDQSSGDSASGSGGDDNPDRIVPPHTPPWRITVPSSSSPRPRPTPVVVPAGGFGGGDTLVAASSKSTFQLTLGIFTGMVIGVVLTVAAVVVLVCCAKKQNSLKTLILTEHTKVQPDFV